ncbi:myo-inosose-2 dehydratase [Aureimonas sp. Leaf324]|jgi:inosose dehydratase/3D-(3,5/4)-trihydroxycyclohexane-1,2-dione acylhydrolase (decyclizing)|uniref:myo-inosose-2 dehydratase n=1 Tax=Aureimonas sp. Leaf324 TaxID=1736336 RepID=UPI0006FE0EC2|nr:myo-inosose-2 dehydratase [Aureimonas sp. Leaf324]KQQ91225.1 myo-inosose-2 dehydratase [Aureimonas sp. Leaf324]
MIRIGANPICWSNDDRQDIGGHISLEQCLSEASAIGIEGMELGHKFPKDPDGLKAKLAEYGMVFVGGWYSTFLLERDADAEFAAAKDHIALVKGAGTDIFIVCECTGTVHGNEAAPLSARPVLDEEQWATLLPRMTRFAELLRDEGLKIAYHHHMGTVIQTGEEIDRLMAGTGDAFTLLLDTGHATWAGADPVDLARRYRDRIVHFHAKDVRLDVARQAGAEDWSFLTSVLAGVYTVPGDGSVDYVSVLKALPDYAGWVVIEAEQDPEKAHPATYVKMGHDNLVRFLSEAGSKR